MMSSVFDVSQLGAHKVKRIITTSRLNEKLGVSELVQKPEEVTEYSPILEPDEATMLVDAGCVWVQTTKPFKKYGRWMTKAGGRRFFCATKPKGTPKTKAPTKVKPKDDDAA
jgi:hypothetical protein